MWERECSIENDFVNVRYKYNCLAWLGLVLNVHAYVSRGKHDSRSHNIIIMMRGERATWGRRVNKWILGLLVSESQFANFHIVTVTFVSSNNNKQHSQRSRRYELTEGLTTDISYSISI